MAEADDGLAPVIPTPLAGIGPDGTMRFEDFFRAHYRDLLKTAMYLGLGSAEAEDAVAQVMEKLFSRWNELHSPLGYARVELKFTVMKAASARRRELGLDVVGAMADQGCADDMCAWESQEAVDGLLAELPLVQERIMREALAGLRPHEIADLLGKNPEAVRQSLRRARTKLKKAVAGE